MRLVRSPCGPFAIVLVGLAIGYAFGFWFGFGVQGLALGLAVQNLRVASAPEVAP